jgi:hypothetical protein
MKKLANLMISQKKHSSKNKSFATLKAHMGASGDPGRLESF